MICSPGGIQGERTSPTTARLTWDEPYTQCVYCPYNASGYEVMAEGLATLTVSRPPCVINGLNPNQEYFFYLYAKAAGNIRSNPSRARIGLYVPDRTPPSKPTQLRTESVASKRVNLAWMASVDNGGVVEYQVFCDGKLMGSTDSTRYTVANLNDMTTYIFMVRARDPDGNYADSDPLTVSTPDWTAPSTPGNLRASAITNSSVVLEWNASQDNVGVSGYELRNGSWLLDTVRDTRYQVAGLSSNTNYSFSVIALDAAGNRSDGTVIWVTTSAESNAPTELRLFRQLGRGDLTWRPPVQSGGVTGYQVFLDGTFLRELSDTFISLYNLTPGTEHLFEVRAIRNGVLSDPASIRG
ncbi:fibronectin type III domain-containing protein [Pseudomonas kielensis]|uniref:fibronectin type III domain-containing protein n=1 Tax=Pseudomonas kielensis TaxID=2762577 RepID=UPI002240672D|nr:fibronectin type III domain-containing protein [Pseudomonas kielensis]UZM15196.1 fibronectin type III domain-containing protein [Pseudomonas kielensis]